MIMLKKIKYYTKMKTTGRICSYAEFNGIEFVKHGEYYVSHKYGRMHRYIYEYYFGPIPNGYHIHHKDLNKNNNDINNLQMLTHKEHTSLHSKEKKTMLGKNHTAETKQKISNAHKGKEVSAEAKQKMSKSHKGKKNAYKPRTPEMLDDIKNGMGPKDFCIKYKCSQIYYYNTKKEIAENAN